jgi:hypothetical protein
LQSELESKITVLLGMNPDNAWWQNIRSLENNSLLVLENLCRHITFLVLEMIACSQDLLSATDSKGSFDFDLCQIYKCDTLAQLSSYQYTKKQLGIIICICTHELRARLCTQLCSQNSKKYTPDPSSLLNDVFTFFGAVLHATVRKILKQQSQKNDEIFDEMLLLMEKLGSCGSQEPVSEKEFEKEQSNVRILSLTGCANLENPDISQEEVLPVTTSTLNHIQVGFDDLLSSENVNGDNGNTEYLSFIETSSGIEAEPVNFTFRNQGGLVKPNVKCFPFAKCLFKENS